MRLSEFLDNIGHPIAVYPQITRITGSSTATIFLCQFADCDDWVCRNQFEIEELTGLSRYEQETARKQLKVLGFLQERRTGLPARLEFYINFLEVEKHWNQFKATGTSPAILQNQSKAIRQVERFKPQDPGFIYVVYNRLNGKHKIGLSKNPKQRIKALSRQSKTELEVVLIFPVENMGKAETELHEEYASKRLHGEWFYLAQDDIYNIKVFGGMA